MRNKDTIEVYTKFASQYEEKWAGYINHTHEKILAELDIEQGDHILDVSAGTGILAEALIKKHRNIQHFQVNDLTPAMLKFAKKRLEKYDNVCFSNYGAENLSGLKSSSFDVVVSLNSLHNYKDKSKALAEIHRVLKKGGKFNILDWNNSGFFKLVKQVIKWSGKEINDPISKLKITELIKEEGMQLEKAEEWNYRYWKFYFVCASKL